MAHRNLCNHRLGGRKLILSTEGHEHRCRTNCRIEALAEPLLTAYVKIIKVREPHILKRTPRIFDGGRELLQIWCFLVRRHDGDADVLTHAVGREEAARDPHDLFSAPLHDKARFCRHDSDLRCLEVLRIRISQECLNILRSEYDRHPLLRLRDRELRAVESLILLRDGI